MTTEIRNKSVAETLPLDVTNYDLEAEKDALSEAERHPEIRQQIQAIHAKINDLYFRIGNIQSEL